MSLPTKYNCGFTIGSTVIPDPSSYKYKVSDLDVSGERDTNGLLHRERVATKHNLYFTYDALDYATATSLLALITEASFSVTFTRPDTNTSYTGTYYVGDRELETIMAYGDDPSDWVCSLTFDLIEY